GLVILEHLRGPSHRAGRAVLLPQPRQEPRPVGRAARAHAAFGRRAERGRHRPPAGGIRMNLFVSDPHWGWWIILYFYLGGLAAGAYFLATLIDIVGRPEDRPLSRLGYLLAFPLVAVCGILLIVDLDRPERFWHMLLQSERVHDALDEGWPGGG